MGPSKKPAPTHQEGLSSAQPQSVSVRFWGTRGSIPCPGPDTVRYGGNTSCVEIQADGTRIILDAGTGLHPLGTALVGEVAEKQVSIFLTHFHWDHVQGLPFFAPAHDPEFTVQVSGPRQGEESVEALVSDQMGPVHFPLALQDFPAALVFSEVEEGHWNHQGIQMRAMRVRHPSVTLGYRVETCGRSVVFIPDNEIDGGPLPTPPGWREELENFVRGSDVLIHDAMFTEEERPLFEGWGHSTMEQVIDLAIRAEVRRLFLFHHAPKHTDADMDRLLMRFREVVRNDDADLDLFAATEGSTVLL